jgi:hypothetical protein
VQTWPVADAVAHSSLPAEKKRELFLYAANHANLEQSDTFPGMRPDLPRRNAADFATSVRAGPQAMLAPTDRAGKRPGPARGLGFGPGPRKALRHPCGVLAVDLHPVRLVLGTPANDSL